MREETRCHHSFRLAARVILYAKSHRQDSTYHGLCYTSRGALAGTRNSSMSPPHEGSIRRPIAPRANALTTELHLAPAYSVTAGISSIDYTSQTVKHWKYVRERNVLFNDSLNTFYLRLYGVSWKY